MPQPGCFNPRKEALYALYQRLGGPNGCSGQVRRRKKSLAPSSVWTQNCPDHSESLHWYAIPVPIYHLAPHKISHKLWQQNQKLNIWFDWRTHSYFILLKASNFQAIYCHIKRQNTPNIKCQCRTTSEVCMVPILVLLTYKKSGHLKMRWSLATHSHAKFHKNLSTGSKVTHKSDHTTWMGTGISLAILTK